MSEPVTTPETISKRLGRAWVFLAAMLAVHVADEALTGFLAFYNPIVLEVRARVPWLPLPTFTFPVWIVGLAVAIALLFALTPLAYRGRRWLAGVAVVLAAIMLANALGHIGGSLYFGRILPGAYSSPLLLVAAARLLPRAWRRWRAGRLLGPA